MATAPTIQPKPRAYHPKRSKVSTQLILLQELAFELANQEGLKASIAAQLMRAFCDLQEERRKLAMRPLPKSVDVSKWKSGKPSSRKPRAPDTFLDQPSPTPSTNGEASKESL